MARHNFVSLCVTRGHLLHEQAILPSQNKAIIENNTAFRNNTIGISQKLLGNPKEGDHLGYASVDGGIRLKC